MSDMSDIILGELKSDVKKLKEDFDVLRTDIQHYLVGFKVLVWIGAVTGTVTVFMLDVYDRVKALVGR